MGAGAAAMAMTAKSATLAQSRPRQPNILLLMGDQHRADAIGADGNRLIKTPNLDRIAAEGVLFRHAYSCTPSCTPVRAALLTGLSPWRHGMLGYGRVAAQYKNEMPAMLREAGYHTLGIGKMHWFPQRSLHGFHKTILDESGRVESPDFVSDYRQWFRKQAPELDPDATGLTWNDYRARAYALPERLHSTCWTGDQAVEFLTNYRDREPFFLKVSFARPHSPYDPPERFWKMYQEAEVPKPSVGRWAERNAMRDVKIPRPDTFRGDLGEQTALSSRRGYYGSVSFLDEQIGRILKALEDRGWLENTFILYTSDHGDMLGDHYLWRKTYAYEGSARVPMLVRWPEGMSSARRGGKCDQVVELRDVLPTFLDAAGVKADPTRFDGQSMLRVIRGEVKGWREYLDLEHSRCYWPGNQWTGLTDGRCKYVYCAYDGSQQLFDLQKDPGECTDLAGQEEHKDTLALWRKRMVQHLSERGEPFVVNGDLGIREKPTLYSPNYPGKSASQPAG